MTNFISREFKILKVIEWNQVWDCKLEIEKCCKVLLGGQIVFNQLRIGYVNQKQEQFKLLLAFWGLVVSP
jgi:hypothetical protein